MTTLTTVILSASLLAPKDLGNGFLDHGVATPVSNHRGIVATVDGQGHGVALAWLYDHSGCYALLLVDVDTGKSEQIAVPFPSSGDCPFASILSTGNRFYTHFGSYFTEFDPTKRAFTFHHKTAPQMAMSMAEDDQGVIWSVTYPGSGVVSYNPKTGDFRDYGHVYKQNWAQYQRSTACDDAGWVYFAVGNTRSQVIALDPQSGQAKPLLAEGERVQASALVQRDLDGKVYAHPGGPAKDKWMVLYRGERRDLGERKGARLKPCITGSQGLFHRVFPDGRILKDLDTVEKVAVVENPKTKESKTIRFEYTSDGAHCMSVAAAPGGTLCGGTAFPMRAFSYNPQTDTWTNRAAHGQWNTVARQGDHFFAGGYGHGFLLDWDPARPWVPTVIGKECNPNFLVQSNPDPAINRPHKLLAHPDGRTLVLAGTPGYGYTGGGLLFWDRETRQSVLVHHTELLPEQSTMSLAALPNGKLLGGTTTAAGTGGEVHAKQAELYILEMRTKKIDWHEPVFAGVQNYNDLLMTPSGLVYGFADGGTFFVFDPATRKVVHKQVTSTEFGGTSGGQGPRIFVVGPDQTIYILFGRGIASVDAKTYAITMLAQSPVPIAVGGDYLDGRLWFVSGSHVLSWQVPAKQAK